MLKLMKYLTQTKCYDFYRNTVIHNIDVLYFNEYILGSQ